MGHVIQNWFISFGLTEQNAENMSILLSILILLFFAWIVYLFASRSFMKMIEKLIRKTKTNWDDILYEEKVFKRIALLVPALIIYFGLSLGLQASTLMVKVIRIFINLYFVIVTVSVVEAVINGFHNIYKTMPVSRDRPVKGLVQIIKIFLYILGAGLLFSIILQKDLTSFFAGLGAMAAVIMLIFKDTIQGFVAGIQLSANNMVRLGDWIEMPGRNANGIITDISLNTVKVQNWDKTVSTIPPYALITESFTNWRGMEESGGRRIKRSLNIDMRSIRFLDKPEIERLKNIHLIRDYIEERESEIDIYNRNNNQDTSIPVNGRRLTNIGTFRKYVEEYLKQNPQIHQNMTFLVRHLQPTDKGLPLEIYVFSKDQRWAYYESIQADIFDHLLAVIPQFYLSIYQSPSGNDLTTYLSKTNQR